MNAPPRLLRLSLLLAALPLWLGIDLLQSRDKAVEEGNAQMKAGKPEQALGNYDDAVKRLPQDPSAHFNRGAGAAPRLKCAEGSCGSRFTASS